MNGLVRSSLTAALVAVLAAAPLGAQLGFHVGVGMTAPASDYAAYATIGWMGMGGVMLSVSAVPIKVQLDGMYGVNDHEGDTGEKTSIYGGMANAVYHVAAGPVTPYVLAGLGYLSRAYDAGANPLASDETVWALAWNVGGGINFAMGRLNLFAEARYLDRDGTAILPVLVGLRLGT